MELVVKTKHGNFEIIDTPYARQKSMMITCAKFGLNKPKQAQRQLSKIGITTKRTTKSQTLYTR